MSIDHESLKIILEQINNNHRDFKNDITGSLERLRGDLNQGLRKKHEYMDVKIRELKQEINEELKEHEKDIKELNRFRLKLLGMSAAVIALVELLFKYVLK